MALLEVVARVLVVVAKAVAMGFSGCVMLVLVVVAGHVQRSGHAGWQTGPRHGGSWCA